MVSSRIYNAYAILLFYAVQTTEVDFEKFHSHSYLLIMSYHMFNPLTAKLFNFNFHPLEVVSR